HRPAVPPHGFEVGRRQVLLLTKGRYQSGGLPGALLLRKAALLDAEQHLPAVVQDQAPCQPALAQYHGVPRAASELRALDLDRPVSGPRPRPLLVEEGGGVEEAAYRFRRHPWHVEEPGLLGTGKEAAHFLEDRFDLVEFLDSDAANVQSVQVGTQ